MIRWQDLHHIELNTQQLHVLLQLRCAVFIVEQQCPYQGVDGDDLAGENRYILGWYSGELVACARILKGDDELELVAISRVIIGKVLRGEELGQQLMAQTLTSCAQHWPHEVLCLGVQAHLQSPYTHFGFIPVMDICDEDGTPHVGTVREAHRA